MFQYWVGFFNVCINRCDRWLALIWRLTFPLERISKTFLFHLWSRILTYNQTQYALNHYLTQKTFLSDKTLHRLHDPGSHRSLVSCPLSIGLVCDLYTDPPKIQWIHCSQRDAGEPTQNQDGPHNDSGWFGPFGFHIQPIQQSSDRELMDDAEAAMGRGQTIYYGGFCATDEYMRCTMGMRHGSSSMPIFSTFPHIPRKDLCRLPEVSHFLSFFPVQRGKPPWPGGGWICLLILTPCIPTSFDHDLHQTPNLWKLWRYMKDCFFNPLVLHTWTCKVPDAVMTSKMHERISFSRNTVLP